MSRKGKASLPQATKIHILNKILEMASGLEKKIDTSVNEGESQCPKTNPKK